MTNNRLVASLAIAAFALGTSAYAADTLMAAKVAKAPKLESLSGDPAWAKAKPLKVALSGGANFKDGATDVVLKAVYSGDMFYMLVQYNDPTESARRSPYQKQADGTWKKVKDPDDAGGDNTKYYEDKFGVLWNINNSIKGFSDQGCMAACHAGEGKPFGNKYTNSPGELGDLWHLKMVRTGYIGQLDDGYLDDTRFDKEKSPNAGRKTDPKTAGGYNDVKLVDGRPEFMDKSGFAAAAPGPVKVASVKSNGVARNATYYLREENKVALDDAKFKPGDEVASILVAPFVGDRGDVTVKAAWNNGRWTYVLARKLVTGSKYDVQFDNLGSTYEFGIAAFDNAQVRHAFQTEALKLKFDSK
jgi:hypothetical protein